MKKKNTVDQSYYLNKITTKSTCGTEKVIQGGHERHTWWSTRRAQQ